MVEYSPAERVRLGGWFFILSLLVALLIFVGGVVRLSGSGLSIPEWPLIQGSLLPPLSDKGWLAVYQTYYRQIHGLEVSGPQDSAHTDLMSLRRFKQMFAIEYLHRLLAALVGIVFLVLLLQAMRSPPLRHEIGARLWGMLILLVVQAVLGGIVVKLDLRAEFVALHLGLAFAFFGLILWTSLMLFLPLQTAQARGPLWPYRLSWLALLLVYSQIISGGLVAASHAGYLYNTWPTMAGEWIPAWEQLWAENTQPIILNFFKNPLLIQFFHRWWAFVAAAAVFALLLATLRLPLSHRARFGLRALGSIVILQLVLGITTLVTRVSLSFAISHLMVGLILFALLVFLTYELKGHAAKVA